MTAVPGLAPASLGPDPLARDSLARDSLVPDSLAGDPLVPDPLAEGAVERTSTFSCFGSECTVIASDSRPDDAAQAVARARRRLLEWHRQFSRFEPESELSRLNADQRETVPVSPLMRRIAEVGIRAARMTRGLVDPTLGAQIERAGYRSHFDGAGVPLEIALSLAPPRAPAAPSRDASWQLLAVDRRAGTITRPLGVKLDVGGIAKGLFADELAVTLARLGAFALDCAGDIRLGGSAGSVREVHVANPFDGSMLHTIELTQGGVATSGIGKRSWCNPDGHLAHHLLDPRTGRPAFTGIVQVTAVAPIAAAAEVLSKAAILSGPDAAKRWLPAGGVIVFDDGSHEVVAAP